MRWTNFALAALFVARTAGLLAVAQPAPAAPQARFVVVLDAAHGGDDTGGRLTNGQLEKSFTLATSVRLRSLLAARGIQVVTTRDSDVAVEPNRRAEIANHAQAQACLSLHSSESGSGLHLLSPRSSAQSVRFPAWKTAQAAWVTRSLKLAGVLNSALLQDGLNVTLGRTSLPAIDSMTCPAVAVEIALVPSPSHETTASLDDKDTRPRGQGVGRSACRVAHGGPSVIPATRRFSSFSVGGRSGHGRCSVAPARARPPAADCRSGLAPTSAPAVAQAEQVTLMVANDSDGSLLTQLHSLPLPADPGASARAVLGKLLDIYAAPDAAHPVPGAEAR